jgi:hypothetical protein
VRGLLRAPVGATVPPSLPAEPSKGGISAVIIFALDLVNHFVVGFVAGFKAGLQSAIDEEFS